MTVLLSYFLLYTLLRSHPHEGCLTLTKGMIWHILSRIPPLEKKRKPVLKLPESPVTSVSAMSAETLCLGLVLIFSITLSLFLDLLYISVSMFHKPDCELAVSEAMRAVKAPLFETAVFSVQDS